MKVKYLRRNQESIEAQELVRHAFALARSLNISTLLVQVNEFADVQAIEDVRGTETILWLITNPDLSMQPKRKDGLIWIPEAELTRFSQLRVAIFRAVLDEKIALDESVVCLSGVAGSRRLDTVVIANARRDFPWFRERDLNVMKTVLVSRAFGRILEIALRLASEGREGKAIGTTFVLGDLDELQPHLRQLIINPCEGHSRKLRSIHNDNFFESIREFSALDGAFLVSTKGVVESAGTYIDAPSTRIRLNPGLGARHAAAASITSNTQSVAVVISESSGAVTVFHDGTSVLELEKPKPVPRRREKRE
jgi:DNA integrity scanning protein DisA with diadenylate cyclase activity